MKILKIVLVMLALSITFTNFNIAGDVKVLKKDLFERRKEVYESKKKELKEAKKEQTEEKTKLDPGFEPFWNEFQKH